MAVNSKEITSNKVITNGKPDINRMARAFTDFINTLDADDLKIIEKLEKEQKENKQMQKQAG